MALIKFNPMAYIKYFSLNAPMIIAAFIVMSSAFNQDIKGIIFMAGASIIMFIGQFISSSLGRKVPKNADLGACNLFSSFSNSSTHRSLIWGFRKVMRVACGYAFILSDTLENSIEGLQPDIKKIKKIKNKKFLCIY